MTFFPVDRDIFSSSIWLTGTPEERCLWWWLLGNKDDDGVVRQRELAIADGAKLPRATVEAALQKFSEPDPDSRTRDNDGRRIARTPEGFVRILNHELYYSKDYSTPRWRRWKERQRANALANDPTPLPTKDKDKDNNGKQTRPAADAASPAGAGLRADVVEVHDYWRSRLHPDAKAPRKSSKRFCRIKARLDEGFTVEQIKRAIDGCAGSEFHRQNKHTDIELICRDAAKLERFISLAPASSTAPTETPEEAGRRRTERALEAVWGGRQ